MTEADWLSSESPEAILAFLRRGGKASERKYRLFAYGAVRRAWHLLADDRSCRAVELAEADADGLADVGELRAAVLGADKAAYRVRRAEARALAARGAAAVAQRAAAREAGRGTVAEEVGRAAQVAQQAARRAEFLARRAEATRAAREASRAAVLCTRAAWYRSRGLPGSEVSLQQAVQAAADAAGDPGREPAIQCDLLRDLFGPLPFRAVMVASSLLRLNDGTVPRIAQGIYEGAAFDRMPILADALLDAGCDNEEMLAHCREQGSVHARGCWVLDLLLGKG